MTITTEPHNGGYALFATGIGGKAIAGPRIFRAPPHPDIQFSHPDKASAEIDAEKLRKYLAQLPVKNNTKKKSTDRSAYD